MGAPWAKPVRLVVFAALAIGGACVIDTVPLPEGTEDEVGRGNPAEDLGDPSVDSKDDTNDHDGESGGGGGIGGVAAGDGSDGVATDDGAPLDDGRGDEPAGGEPGPGDPALDGPQPPSLERVEGDSPMPDARGRHRLRTGLVLSGAHLGDATVTLTGDGVAAVELTQRSASDDRVVVDLPAALVPGSYELTVSTTLGSASASVVLLRGEPGSTEGCP